MPFVILLIFLVFKLSNVDVALKNRLLDKTETNIGYNNKSAIERIGSGRIIYFLEGLNIYSELTLLEKIIGIGEENAKDEMLKRRNIRIFTHNGYLDILIHNGLLGLIIFIIAIIIIIRFINSSQSIFTGLAKAYFTIYLIMNIVQGGPILYDGLFLSGSLVLIILDDTKNKKNVNCRSFKRY